MRRQHGNSERTVPAAIIWIFSLTLAALLAAVAVLGASVRRESRSEATASFAPAPTASPAPEETVAPTASPASEETVAPTASPAPEETVAPTASPAPEERFSDHYIDTENSHTANNVSCTLYTVTDEEHFSERAVYYVADIYVRDAAQIRTGFAGNTFEKMSYGSMTELCADTHALAAVSGDYARDRAYGLVIRNGEVLREELDPDRDVGVLFRDGTFETYEAGSVPVAEIMAREPWQCWCFGPALLDENGKHKTAFRSDVTRPNPRAVFGYYEPGHYCFVVVDGRSKKSGGLTLEELSLLMEMLGCTRAINLDGGATAQLAWRGRVVNKPAAGRRLNDIIYVGYGNGLTAPSSAGETPVG